jgi:hypothetical protein
MTNETDRQDQLTQVCWRTRRASVPTRLRARGRGASGARLILHRHRGLDTNFVATANELRRSGTATRHVCGRGVRAVEGNQAQTVHSVREVSPKWLDRRISVTKQPRFGDSL